MIIFEIITKVIFAINFICYYKNHYTKWKSHAKFEAARGFFFYLGYENDITLEIQSDIDKYRSSQY